MSIVALIPARGGSKGIPGKNIASCGGKPLIAHTILAAREAAGIDRVLVSTDDDNIAAVALDWGAEVPFRRPESLSGDEVPMIGVLQHALSWLESAREQVDALVLLQPTSPLRRAAHIDGALGLFLQHRPTSVVSIVEVPHRFHPMSVLKLEQGYLSPYLENAAAPARRQEKPPVFARNGPAILVSTPAAIRSGTLYGDRCMAYPMPHRESIDIDDPEDLELANLLMQHPRK